MRRSISLFFIIAVSLTLFTWHSSSWSAEIKTLPEFQNSSFIKKYSQSKPMESWPLKTGGYSNSFTFDLKIDKNSIVLLEILTKSEANPSIYRYSTIFHSAYTKKMTSFFHAFFSAVDSSLDAKAVTDYIQKRAAVKLRKSSDAPKQTFGKYSVRVSNVLNGVTVSLEKREGT
jgi:hypothetical protein